MTGTLPDLAPDLRAVLERHADRLDLDLIERALQRVRAPLAWRGRLHAPSAGRGLWRFPRTAGSFRDIPPQHGERSGAAAREVRAERGRSGRRSAPVGDQGDLASYLIFLGYSYRF